AGQEWDRAGAAGVERGAGLPERLGDVRPESGDGGLSLIVGVQLTHVRRPVRGILQDGVHGRAGERPVEGTTERLVRTHERREVRYSQPNDFGHTCSSL